MNFAGTFWHLKGARKLLGEVVGGSFLGHVLRHDLSHELGQQAGVLGLDEFVHLTELRSLGPKDAGDG